MFVRPKIIVGNWKMHKTIEEAQLYIEELEPLLVDVRSDVCLAVPFTCLGTAAKLVSDCARIRVGAQNMSEHEEGAWTGEISAHMIKEAGASFVILGHSERRSHFGESNAVVNTKLTLACRTGLQSIVCVGESLGDRNKNCQKDVIALQLSESLAGFPREKSASLVLAYEPVWAIGTGKNATPEDAQAVHSFCRQILENLWDKETAQKVSILYGGSVKPENAPLLLMQQDVDGLLVGGAALNAYTFSQIIHATLTIR